MDYDVASELNNKTSNECEPYQQRYPDILDYPFLQVILGTLYTCVWLAGVGGNTVVLYVALAKRLSFSLRTVFIVSLACSDLVVAMTSLPVTSITLLSHNWLFPNFLCNSISFVQGCGIFQSSFTLTAIAVDRYMLIFYPHRSIITNTRARASTVLMCVHGMLLATPMAVFTRIKSWRDLCGVFCEEDWGSDEAEWARRLYGSAVLILQFSVPLFVSCFCYIRISRHLDGRVTQRLRHEIILPEAMKRLDERRTRTNRMMVVMVLSFLLTWCPFNLLNILRDFEIAQPLIQLSIYNTLYAFTHLMAMTSLIWNPIIYAWFNESFRAAIREAIRELCVVCGYKSYAGSPNYYSTTDTATTRIIRNRMTFGTHCASPTLTNGDYTLNNSPNANPGFRKKFSFGPNDNRDNGNVNL